jgi:hypothetical protein
VAQAHIHEQALTKELMWEIARVNETLHQERTYLARAIHGPVQSRVAAASRLIEQTVRSGGDVQGVIDDVRESLLQETILLDHGPEASPLVGAGLVTIQQTWSGVCEVLVDISPEVLTRIEADWITSATVKDVLVDAVANAAMHGSAKRVFITAELVMPDALMIEVRDDGTFSGVSSPAGLGTMTLDDVAISWSLDRDHDETRLRVMIPAPMPSMQGIKIR